jgi:tetratricopeptide (TPR) repeat protein
MQDPGLLRLALERGWITREEAEAGLPAERILTAEQIRELAAGRALADRLLQAGLPLSGQAPQNFGRYRIKQELGAGGCGRVYLAFDPILGRDVAVKILERGSAELAERFRREMEILAALRHPNIVAILDAGTHDGQPYYAMEYVGGRSLRDAALPTARAVEVLEQVARACHAAHQKGIIHRDLKPANILLGDRPVVVDFGVARVQADPLTRTGETLGTPHYMSPEQARGESVDARSDVFSMGVLLYEILARRPPFTGSHPLEVLKKIEEQDPAPPRSIDPKIPADLENVALKALAKEPALRYATALQFAEDLAAWREGRPVLARPAPPWRRASLFLRRNRRAAAFSAALLVLMAVTTAVSIGSVSKLRLGRAQNAVLEETRRIQQWATNLYKPPREISYEELDKSAANLDAALSERSLGGPFRHEAHLAKARARIYMGRTQEAIEDLTSAIRTGRGYPIGECYFERARLRWDEAIRAAYAKNESEAEKILQVVKEDLRAGLSTGFVDPWTRDFAAALLDLADSGEAAADRSIARLEALSRAREKPAEEVDKALGDIYLVMKKPDRAVEKYSKAKTDRQCYVQAYNGLALAYLAQEQVASAIENVSRAIDINPRYEPSYFMLSLACRRALRAPPNKLATFLHGESERLLRQGLGILRTGTRALPGSTPLLVSRGYGCVLMAFGLLGRKEDPEPLVQEAVSVLTRAPADEETLIALGVAHLIRALHAKSREESDRSRECLERAARAAPRSADARRWLGYLHSAAERYGPAVQAWEEALALDPSLKKELDPAIEQVNKKK